MNEQAREHETEHDNQPVDETPETVDESAAEEFVEDVDPFDELRNERDELYARLQRVSADYQNFMRRSETNLVDSIHLASGDVLKRFVPVLDHFDTALGVETKSEDAKALHDGFRIVRDELLKVLQQAGVERVEPQVGDAFDPHRHEAMLQQTAEGVNPGHIAMVFQPGYVYKNRTLRAAKVAVVPE
jgi:molecular chaperone GrpE